MTTYGRNDWPINTATNAIASDDTMTTDFTVHVGAIEIATSTGASSPTSSEVFLAGRRSRERPTNRAIANRRHDGALEPGSWPREGATGEGCQLDRCLRSPIFSLSKGRAFAAVIARTLGENACTIARY